MVQHPYRLVGVCHLLHESLQSNVAFSYAHLFCCCTGKPLSEFAGGTAIPKEDLLYLPCDVLVPAAIGGVIDKDNADKLQCKFVAEAANGPTTPEVRQQAFVSLSVILGEMWRGGGRSCSAHTWQRQATHP